MEQNANALGLVASPDIIERARDLVRRHGADRARIMLGVSRETLTRIIAGLGVRRGTLVVVELALEKMKPGAAPAPTRTRRQPTESVLAAPRLSASAAVLRR